MSTATNREDSAFQPDPPRKVKFSQALALFVYHVLLALFLAYAMYKVWPPQPWPGDERARAQENSNAKRDRPASEADLQNQNSSTTENTNTASGAGTAGENANTKATTNTNANTNVSGNANNSSQDTDRSGDNGADSGEPSTDIYGGERPPPFWIFRWRFQPPLEVRLLLLVLLAGAIGSYIHASSSFVDYLGNRTMITSWIWWYLLRPFIGMMLALLFYFLFRGGFITAGVNSGGEGAASFINPFGIAAVAGLVGMFSKVAADKLNEVFLTLFAPKTGQGDAKRGDKLTRTLNPTLAAIVPNKGPAAGNTEVTISGTNFLVGVAVNFGEVASPTVTIKDATTLTVITPEHEPGVVDVEVVNPNNLTAVLKDGFTYLEEGDEGSEGEHANDDQAGE